MHITDGPPTAPATFLFAHGAGAPMDTPFMNTVARGLAARGIRVVRFEFRYMAARREGKKKGGPPDRQPVLLETFRRVVEEHGGGAKVVIGGKSMGGRMASLIADEVGARGLLCLGYPFHPPGKPAQVRTAHLADLRTPTLILQGTRDIFGNPDDVAPYVLSSHIRVEWLENGDHSLKGQLDRAIDLGATFILQL
ncbi:MAG: alpha/beta hydrolase [Acidobacteriota bacterium]|nr:alpha/beta hydrolase [Acidobacteriota bacterium]